MAGHVHLWVLLGPFQDWLWVLISAPGGSAREDNRAGGHCPVQSLWLEEGLGGLVLWEQKSSYGAGMSLIFPAIPIDSGNIL